jgi:transcriptional regulator with XRE-family HTH domain
MSLTLGRICALISAGDAQTVADPTRSTMDGPPPHLTFGRYIRHLRENRGWTQEQLREKADGLGSGTVSKIENDEGERKQGTLESLAKAFDFETAADLLIDYERFSRGEAGPAADATAILRRRHDHGLDPEALRLAEQIQKLTRRARLHVEALILAWEEAETARNTKER